MANVSHPSPYINIMCLGTNIGLVFSYCVYGKLVMAWGSHIIVSISNISVDCRTVSGMTEN